MKTHEKALHVFSHAVVILLFALYVAANTTNPNTQGIAVGISSASGVVSFVSLLIFFVSWID